MAAQASLIPTEAYSFVGKPDGPNKYIESLGMEVPTFLSERHDLMKRIAPTLMYHVPLGKRGPYQVAGTPPNGERLTGNNFALCNMRNLEGKRGNQTRTGPFCEAKAVNWCGLCPQHGGALHPLDKQIVNWSLVPRHVRFKYNKLDIDDLDDEELARGQVRLPDGTWSRNEKVPQEVHDACVRKLFERADTKLRENLVVAVDEMIKIGKSDAVEPADRINALKWAYERVRGRVPTEVIVTQEKPFEVVLAAGIQGGSRADSRAARGVLDNVVDAEFSVEDGDMVVGAINDSLYDEDLESDGSYGATTHPQAASPPVPVEVPPSIPEEGELPPGIAVGPPEDPILRDQYEKDLAAERAAKIAEAKAELQRARARRYAARANGFDSVVPIPFEIEVEHRPEYGPRATAIFWIEPKEPKLSQAQHEKAKKRSRRGEGRSYE